MVGLSIKTLPNVFFRHKRSLPIGLKILVTPLLFSDCKYYHWREYKYVIIRDSLTFIFLGPTNTQEDEQGQSVVSYINIDHNSRRHGLIFEMTEGSFLLKIAKKIPFRTQKSFPLFDYFKKQKEFD
jgi:hypothetical protein